MQGDVALQIVAELLDAMDSAATAGGSVAYDADVQKNACEALSSLAESPMALMLAETLCDKTFQAFRPALDSFLTAMEAVTTETPAALPVSLLQKLTATYRPTRDLLLDYCRCLHCPQAASLFPLSTQSAMLQPNLTTGVWPKGKRELLVFLKKYGQRLLAAAAGDAREEDPEEEAKCFTKDASASSTRWGSTLDADPVLFCLDELGLSRTHEIESLWQGVLAVCIDEKMDSLDGDYSEHMIESYMTWERHVVEPLARRTLSYETTPVENDKSKIANRDREPASANVTSSFGRHGHESSARPCSSGDVADGNCDRWCSAFRERLLVAYAHKRIECFWDIMVEFPDSLPALEDLRLCLQSCPHSNIKERLVRHARVLLAQKLHRAGTGTEDILLMLSNAVHALCVLVPRNEQSSVVFSVVSATLEHLRRRRGCVSAVVQVLTHAENNAVSTHVTPSAPSLRAADDPDAALDGDGEDENRDTGNVYGGTFTSSCEQPDILRYLLTAIPVKSLTREYQNALAEHLLGKDMHDFDTTPEEEVLERLKRVLGGDVLPDCEVMVHDIQMSKRTTNRMREILSQKLEQAPADELPPESVSLDVLSLTVWPSLSRCLPAGEPVVPPAKFKCHPTLQREMDRTASAYKDLMRDQKLSIIQSQGRITLDVKQQKSADADGDYVTTSHTLSLFSASVVLHLMEHDGELTEAEHGISVESLAAMLEVTAAVLRPHLSPLSPSLLVFCPSSSDGEQGAVRLQRVAPSASRVLFADASQRGGSVEDSTQHVLSQLGSSLDEEQLELLRATAMAMLQNTGAASAGDILNSLKMFTGLPVTGADLKYLMHTLVSDGSVVLTETKQYAVA